MPTTSLAPMPGGLDRDIPVLVIDAVSDISDPLIHYLAQHVHCPITAVVDSSHAGGAWEASMTKLGVRVHHLGRFHLHAEKRQLVAAHPRVFLYAMDRMRTVATPLGDRPQPVAEIGAELASWVQACQEENSQHVVYVSTASPERFVRVGEGSLERVHASLEAKLTQGTGVQRWTVLRPVSVMSLRTPTRLESGWEEPSKVLARLDPSMPQQLIAPDDVARIAGLAFTHPAEYGRRTLDLAGDCLSPEEEARTRTVVLRIPARVFMDPQWVLAGLQGRPLVPVDATRAMLPGVQRYSEWFAAKMKVWFASQGKGHRDDVLVQKKSSSNLLVPPVSRIHRKSF